MNVDEIITLLDYIRDDDRERIEVLFDKYLSPIEGRIDFLIMKINDLKDRLPLEETEPIAKESDEIPF